MGAEVVLKVLPSQRLRSFYCYSRRTLNTNMIVDSETKKSALQELQLAEELAKSILTSVHCSDCFAERFRSFVGVKRTDPSYLSPCRDR